MIDRGFVAEVKKRTSLAELIGAEVQLKRAGREWCGLCPFHQERTSSFYVIEDKAFWHCFGCGESGDAVQWVMKTRQADFRQAFEYLAVRCGLSDGAADELAKRPIVSRPAAAVLAEKEARKIGFARSIWARHLPIDRADNPVAVYLRGRGIRLKPPPTIGFVPDLEHPYLGPPGKGPKFPAMVSPFQNLERKIVGVECTYLQPRSATAATPTLSPRADWVKLQAPADWPPDEPFKAKIQRGAIVGAAMRLTAAEDVMVLAEGRETALSVLQALYDDEVGCPHIDGEPVGIWACGSISNFGNCQLPAGVREVILAADGDGKIPDATDTDRKDPEAVVAAAAAKHRAEGRNVRIARAPAGTDFNDLLPPGVGNDPAAAGLLVDEVA